MNPGTHEIQRIESRLCDFGWALETRDAKHRVVDYLGILHVARGFDSTWPVLPSLEDILPFGQNKNPIVSCATRLGLLGSSIG